MSQTASDYLLSPEAISLYQQPFRLISDATSGLTVGIRLDSRTSSSPRSAILPKQDENAIVEQPPSTKVYSSPISSYQSATSYRNSTPVQIVVTTVSTTTTSPKIYFISPEGNDDNAGTSPKTAWKSLSKINSLDLNPGDRVLLQGGYTYDGNLDFTEEDQGSPTARIEIASYGGGRATINAGNGTGIKVYNAAGYRIRDINIVGSGVGSNSGSGIEFYTDLPGDVKLRGITIYNVDVSGFRESGILLGSWNQLTGYGDVKMGYLSTHDNGKAGLLTYAQVPNVHENVYIAYVTAYNNLGIPNHKGPSGSGIVLGNMNGAILERSLAYNNGGIDATSSDGGPVGVYAYDSTNLVFQYNESSNNHTASKVDGGGFDFDHNVSNSIMQYNYSHNNDGPGYLLAHGENDYDHTGNIIRYNISHNDARKNSLAGILLWGRIVNAQIYNNTVVMSPSSTGTPWALAINNQSIERQDVSSVHIRNNIFQTIGSSELFRVSKEQLDNAQDLLFQGNNYYTTGENFKILWGGTTYNSLESWSSATGQEKLEGVSVGSSFDPLWANNLGEPTFINDPDALNSLDAYRLSSSSPLIDKGLNLRSLFNIDAGTRDFNGTSLPQGLGYDIGAVESF